MQLYFLFIISDNQITQTWRCSDRKSVNKMLVDAVCERTSMTQEQVLDAYAEQYGSEYTTIYDVDYFYDANNRVAYQTLEIDL